MNRQAQLQEEFGYVLRAERKKKGLSQERLAFACGLDRTFISLLERGLRQPTLTTIYSIAETLDIKGSSLLARVEKRA